MFGETLPELPPRERLADVWRDMGCATADMNGVAPFSWQELQAFSAATDCALAPAEARCLIDMSRAYASAVSDENPLSIAPMERKHD